LKLDPETLKQRSTFFQKVRQFFLDSDYLEVDTPHLVRHPSLEPFLDPYCIELEQKLHGVLITSPEFALKKILSRDSPKIFEIAHAYRKDEPGCWHTSEFRMLEWYTIDQTLDQLISQSKDLLKLFFPDLNAQTIELQDWFEKNFGHGFEQERMQKTLIDQGVEQVKNMDFNELFFRLFLPTESKLNELGIVFLKGYPEELCAYATTQAGLAQRFEIYIEGTEVANAYLEEKDPERLQQLLETEQNQRLKLNKDTFEIDIEFVNALKDFTEPISGIAMGLDRVFALSIGKHELAHTSPFSNFNRLSQEG
jgi:lysyl-tRNA synthetase class 2